jgi:5'-3' exonuclease
MPVSRGLNPILVDADNVIKRAIMVSALDDLKAGGVWTGGVYGALSMLAGILRRADINPAGVYAFFDCGVPAKRRKLIPTYKAERAERRKLLSDEDHAKAMQQLATTRELWEAMGVICLSYKEREADDCVAAAVRVFRDRNVVPVVVSSDRDLWQTVGYGAHVMVLGNKDDLLVTPDNFDEHAGVPMGCYLLYRTLVGDSSDSIKGAEGCGPKRAVELLESAREQCGFGFDRMSTPDQLEVLCNILSAKDKRRKYEDSIIASQQRLVDVIEGIDLRRSFGSRSGLEKRLSAVPQFNFWKTMRVLKRLELKQAMGDPFRYVHPFRDAAERAKNIAQCGT